MPSFFNLLAAAGNSAMPNTVAPMFMMVPNYVYSSTDGGNTMVTDVFTVAPDCYFFQINQAANSIDTSLNILTGSSNGAPVISFVYSTGGTSTTPVNAYNDSSFANQSFSYLGRPWYATLDASTTFPDAVGPFNVSSYSFLNPASGTSSLQGHYRLGNDVYNIAAYGDGAPTTGMIEKLTGGVQQYMRRIAVSGVSTSMRGLYPLSDGSCIVSTNRGVLKLSTTGTVVWTIGTFSGDSTFYDRQGAVSPDEAYIYTVNGNTLVRLTTATGVINSFTLIPASLKATGTSFTNNPQFAHPVAIDGNGNLWATTNAGGSTDTIACYQQNGTFVRKYTIAQEDAYRARIQCVAADGDYIVIGGLISQTDTVAQNAFLAKLAVDGSTVGSGYAAPASGYGSDRFISVLTSTSDSNISWSTTTSTSVTHTSTAITSYSIQSLLAAGKVTQNNPTRKKQGFTL
jgi:hypothetical protein